MVRQEIRRSSSRGGPPAGVLFHRKAAWCSARICAVVLSLLALASNAQQAALVFNDTFEPDGLIPATRNDDPGPGYGLDIQWRPRIGSQAHDLSVVNDPVLGNALQFNPGASPNLSMIGQFDNDASDGITLGSSSTPASLGTNFGDQLRFSADFRTALVTNGNLRCRICLELDPDGPIATDPGSDATWDNNCRGYYVSFPNGNSGAITLWKEDGTDSGPGTGSDTTQLSSGITGVTAGLCLDTNKHTLVMELTRLDSGVRIDAYWDGVRVSTATDSDSPYTSFNSLIVVYGAATPYLWDNVRLESVAPAAGTPAAWAPSGLEGGGTQNALAIQPGSTDVMVDGADVAGFHRTTNCGRNWVTSNIGVNGASFKVATAVFSNNPQKSNTVYAGTGNVGSGGGFLVSTNAGQSWILKSTTPQFSGNGETDVPTLTGRWPRSTGNLIAVDEAGSAKYLYAGTFQDGVMRSTDGGSTWTTVGLSNKFIRSIVLDPNSPGTLYVAAYSNYIWKITTARTTSGTGTAGWTQLVNAPNKAEELLMLGTNLYAAGKDDSAGGGVWKSSNAGGTWVKLGGSALATTTTWTGIDGYNAGGADVLYVGATDPVNDGTGTGFFRTVMRSVDGGVTWSDITMKADIQNEVGGAGGHPWWLMGNAAFYELGHGSCDCAMIRVNPANPDQVFFVGRSGVWGTTNATAGTPLWYPMVAGLSVTVTHWLAVDPNHPERVYVALDDWTFVCSSNHAASFVQSKPVGADTAGYYTFVDPIDSTVYLAAGSRDSNTNGEIYSNPNPTDPASAWTAENLSALTRARTRGLVAGRDGGGNRVILAAVATSGLYRKVDSAWTLVNSTIKPDKNDHVQFAWNEGSSNVFLFHQNTGLWRSRDYGATWSMIWAHPSNTVRTGYLVEDPNQEGLLYISCDDGGVYRMEDAQDGVAVGNGIAMPTEMGGPVDPGAMALANGILYACDRATPSHDARICQWLNPANSTACVNIADAVIYPGMANSPGALVAGPDGHIYSCLSNNGVIVGGAPVYPAAPMLQWSLNSDRNLVLSWQGPWVLQHRAALGEDPSTWVDEPGATNPYTVPMPSPGAQFYRLRSP